MKRELAEVRSCLATGHSPSHFHGHQNFDTAEARQRVEAGKRPQEKAGDVAAGIKPVEAGQRQSRDEDRIERMAQPGNPFPATYSLYAFSFPSQVRMAWPISSRPEMCVVKSMIKE